MNISGIVMSVLLLSATAYGMGYFFIDTAMTYGVPTAKFGVLETTFNQSSAMNANINGLQGAIADFQAFNPLSYLQFASRLALVVFDIPGTMLTIINAAASETFLIPPWAVAYLGLIATAVVVMAAIRLMASGGGQI